MPFLIVSRTPTKSFTAGAEDAAEALSRLKYAEAAGYEEPVCTDPSGRAYTRDLVQMVADEASASPTSLGAS